MDKNIHIKKREKMIQKDELDEIFVDKNEPADKSLLVNILKGYATIDIEGNINYSEKCDKLSAPKKVLIYLCCKKAMVLRDVKGMKESSTQSEVSAKALVSLNVAKHALHRDYKKLLKKDGNGYIIPNYHLKRVKEIISGGENAKN